jgi:hypothetical protein
LRAFSFRSVSLTLSATFAPLGNRWATVALRFYVAL